MSTISEYYEALERLLSGKPEVLSKGGKINLDTVALEAGRKRGSIKKSRSTFAGLIADIEAVARQSEPIDRKLPEQLKKTKLELKELKLRYLHSINREIMLSNRLRELEAIVDSENVTAIRSRS